MSSTKGELARQRGRKDRGQWWGWGWHGGGVGQDDKENVRKKSSTLGLVQRDQSSAKHLRNISAKQLLNQTTMASKQKRASDWVRKSLPLWEQVLMLSRKFWDISLTVKNLTIYPNNFLPNILQSCYTNISRTQYSGAFKERILWAIYQREEHFIKWPLEGTIVSHLILQRRGPK